MSISISGLSRTETYRRIIVFEPQSSPEEENDSGFSSRHDSNQQSSNFSYEHTNSDILPDVVTPSKFLRKSNKSCKHCIQLVLELGHIAKPRKSPSNDGCTHDWEFYLKSNQAEKHLIQYVEFQLHDSFSTPKIVQREPPFVISRSGYATFLLLIDVHLKKLNDTSKPRKLRFCYNLVLDSHQSIHCIRYEKLTFVNPDLDLKSNLQRAGGIELKNCGGNLSVCNKCNKGSLISLRENKERTRDSGLGELSENSHTPCQKLSTKSRRKTSRISGFKNSKLASRYKPTPEKLLGHTESSKGIILSTPRSKSQKKVRFAKDNVFFNMHETFKKRPGRPRKYPKIDDEFAITNSWDDQSHHQPNLVDNFFFEPFASPKKNSEPALNIVKNKVGRPRKMPIEDKFQKVKLQSKQKPSFFQTGPSLGTRNIQKSFSNPPHQNFNVTIPNFLIAPNDEDDSGSTDYNDDDDDDDVICIEEEEIKLPSPPPPIKNKIIVEGVKKRGRPPKKNKELLKTQNTYTNEVTSAATNPFPMIVKEKRKRGRPPKMKDSQKIISNNTTNSMRVSSIDSALYSSSCVVNNENEPSRINSTQEFSTTIISSTTNILTSTPLKSSNITNSSDIRSSSVSDYSKSVSNILFPASDKQKNVKEEISEDKLVELQHKLSNLSDPTILRKVVKIIEQSGSYRIDGTIFDFDLCTLDDGTVQSLIECFE